jgi:hypothetical protein
MPSRAFKAGRTAEELQKLLICLLEAVGEHCAQLYRATEAAHIPLCMPIDTAERNASFVQSELVGHIRYCISLI